MSGDGDRAGRPRAVERLREDPRHRRLAGSARPGEEVRLAHLVVLDRVLQRPDDRLLPDDLVEALRAVLPVERRHPAGFNQVERRRRCPAARSVVEIGITGGTCVALLGSGGAAAPERESLALLPSGPDAVRTLPVRGTRSSTLRAQTQSRRTVPRTAFGPAWSGFRVQGTADSPPSAAGQAAASSVRRADRCPSGREADSGLTEEVSDDVARGLTSYHDAAATRPPTSGA